MSDSGFVFLQRLAFDETIAAYAEQIRAAAAGAGAAVATAMEDDAKENAPWQDRTGDARRGLFGTSEVDGDWLRIFISHGLEVPYGIFLELANGGQYQVILPTLERHADTVYPEIAKRLPS